MLKQNMKTNNTHQHDGENEKKTTFCLAIENKFRINILICG